MSKTSPTPGKNNKAIGVVLVVAGATLGALVYFHRPPTGVGDLFERGDTFFLNENVYYALLALAVLLGLAGLLRISKK